MCLLFPLMMLLLFGTMDFARIFFAGIAMASAARAGVQYGSISVGKAGDVNGMNQAAQNDAAGQGLAGVTAVSRTFCGCSSGTAEVSCETGTCGSAIPNGYVETTAQYTFESIARYPGIPNSVLVSRTARMRVQ